MWKFIRGAITNEKTAALCAAWAAVVAVLVACFAIWEGRTQYAATAKLAHSSLGEQIASNRRQWKQFDAEQRKWFNELEAERQRRIADQANQQAQERKAMAPFLAIIHSCNPRPIETGEWVDLDTRKPLDGKALLLKQHTQRLQPGEEITKGLVAVVENIGGGPALECRIKWNVEKAVCLDGSELSADKIGDRTYENDYLVPRVINSAANGVIRGIPACVAEDGDRKITWIEGSVTLSCKDFVGADHSFSQRFCIQPVSGTPQLLPCVPHNADPLDTEWLLFHFNELGDYDGPFPHRTPLGRSSANSSVEGKDRSEYQTLKPITP